MPVKSPQEEVPEDLARGLSGAPRQNSRHLIEAQPEAVIRYLEKHGVSQLGSFHVPVPITNTRDARKGSSCSFS
ncbi:hypothetical protein WJX77_008993 [Trebouxia sp. C0004]